VFRAGLSSPVSGAEQLPQNGGLARKLSAEVSAFLGIRGRVSIYLKSFFCNWVCLYGGRY